jgi:hypothetical protein
MSSWTVDNHPPTHQCNIPLERRLQIDCYFLYIYVVHVHNVVNLLFKFQLICKVTTHETLSSRSFVKCKDCQPRQYRVGISWPQTYVTVACSKTCDRNWHASKDVQPVGTLSLQLADGAVHNIGDNIYLSGLSVLLAVVTNIIVKYSSWKLSLKLYLRIWYAFRFILKTRRIKLWYQSSTCPFRILYGGNLHWGYRAVFILIPIQYR